MAKAKSSTATTLMSYKDRISQTQTQKEAAQLEIQIQQASLDIQMGVLSISGQRLTAESEVKSAESQVSQAARRLEEAKSSQSNIVQDLVDSYQALLQANENLTAAQTKLAQMDDLLTFIKATQAELFPA
jgi:chromosome segregation ATPase